MKKKYIIAIILLTVINLSALGTMVYHRCFGKACLRHQAAEGKDFLCRQLCLSDSQMEQMHAIRQTCRKHINEINIRLQQKQSDLLDLLQVQDVDSFAVEVSLASIHAIQVDLQRRVIRNLLKEKAILTPKQQTRFFFIMKQRMLNVAGSDPIEGIDPTLQDCEEKCGVPDKNKM